MEPISFFDCSCSFGTRRVVRPGSFYSAEDLVRKMDYYGIKKALVYHSMSREYNPAVGNKILLEEIKNYSSLYPVWVAMPHNTGEFPHPEELAGLLKVHNIRAVRMFPAFSEHNFSLSKWNCGGIFEVLEKQGILFMIGMDQMNWNELHDICSSYPELKVLLTDVNYRIDRNIYALFELFPHLHIETIGYKVHCGIEEICKRFGAQRLVFGSSMPLYSGGAAVSMINYASISEEEKHMIAHENLERLIGGASR